MCLQPWPASRRPRKGPGGAGRKPKLSDKQIREMQSLLADPTAQVKEIVARYGVSRTPVYKRVGVVQPGRQRCRQA